MTIPVQPVQINPSVVQQPSLAEQIAPLLEAINHQRLAQAQLENVRGMAEERRIKAAQTARDLQDQADAAKAFYQHVSGAAQTIKPPRPDAKTGITPQHMNDQTGELIPAADIMRTLSPGALEHYGQLVREYNTTVQQTHEATKTQAASELASQQAAILGEQRARDETTHTILQHYGPQLATERGQAQALAEIAATGDVEGANKLATTFNVGSGRFQHFVAPDGFLYEFDTKNGRARQSRFVGTKIPNALNQEAVRRGAQTIVELLDEQHKIVQTGGLGGSKNPTLAQLAQTGRVLGVSTEAIANMFRSDPQQITQMLKTRFAHNYVGLLPHSRSASNLLTNLVESYWAPAGSSPALLRRAEQDRIRLRAIMAGVANGTVTDMSKLPGFAEALQAAIAENAANPAGQADPNAPPPNPQDWVNGVPPQ